LSRLDIFLFDAPPTPVSTAAGGCLVIDPQKAQRQRQLVHACPVWSKIKTDLSRGGVMIETQHPTEPDSSFHRAKRWN